MRFHPVQSDQNKIQMIADLFRESMDRRGVLPKNPWKAKRLTAWLSKMGARFHPGSHHYRAYKTDPTNYVNFKVDCPKFKGYKPYKQPRIKGYRGGCFVCIEIPWDLADKVLTLGHLP